MVGYSVYYAAQDIHPAPKLITKGYTSGIQNFLVFLFNRGVNVCTGKTDFSSK